MPPQLEELTMVVSISCHGKYPPWNLHHTVRHNKRTISKLHMTSLSISIHTGTWTYQSSPVSTSQGPSSQQPAVRWTLSAPSPSTLTLISYSFKGRYGDYSQRISSLGCFQLISYFTCTFWYGIVECWKRGTFVDERRILS